jgi:tetratricopeptide (TPR) repeat protein
VAYFLDGRDDPAQELLADLQGESPHDTEVLYYLAAIQLRKGDLEKGRRYLRSLLAIDPDDGSALRLLGLSLSDEPGQEREALNLLLRAEVSGADIDGLSCILGTLYLRAGLPDRAHGEFLYCLAEKPDFPGAHLGLGLIADDMGRKGEAIEHLERYLALEPEPEPTAFFRLGVAYLRSGRDADGFDTLRQLVALRADTTEGPPPRDQDLLEMTSFFLATVRRFEDAAFIGEMLLTRNPQNPIYNNNLAMTYADAQTNLERALQLAEKANRLDAENPGHMDTLGWVLLRLQRFAEAESTLTASARLAESSEIENTSEIYFHLGVLYHLTDRPDQAVEALGRAGENPPTPFLRDEIHKLLDEVTGTGDR